MATAVKLPPKIDADEFLARGGDQPSRTAAEELREAATRVGYRPRSRRTQDTRDLAAILAEHEIRFYDPGDIDEYKKAQVRVRRETLRKKRNASFRGFLLLSSPIAAILLFGPITTSSTLTYLLVSVGCLMLVALAGWSLKRLILSQFEKWDTVIKWVRFPLREYKADIPLSALRLATTLHRANPQLKFRVEELQVQRVSLDPLLYVRKGKGALCIAVWDEPDFDAPLRQ